MKPGAVTSVASPSLQITHDRFISFKFLSAYNRSCTIGVHCIQPLQDQSLSLSVFHTVVVRMQGQWRMMISVLYKRGAAGAPNAGTYNTDFPGLAKENSYLIKSYTRFYRLLFPLPSVLTVSCNAATPCSFFPAGCASRPTWAPEGFRTSALSSDNSSTWWWTRPSKRTSSPPAQLRTSTARP